ncbi:MAG: FxLYD domain-containing protein [Chloroflexota bacterium]
MNTKIRSRWPIAAAALALGIVACTCGSLGGGAVTSTPEPLPTAAPTQVGIPTKPPIVGGEGIGGGGSDLAVINTAFLPRSDGGWRLLGEVANNSSTTVSSVSLQIEWFDASGTSLGSDTGYALTTNIVPGETAPFIYSIYDTGLQLGSFTATITEFTSVQDFPRAKVDVEHAVLTVDDFGDFHCTGELANNTSAPVTIGGLAAAVLDKNGALVSADSYWAAIRHLEPGERTPFRISPVGFSGAVASDHSCHTYVDAETAEAIPPAAVAFVDANGDGDSGNDIHLYVDVLGSGHLVGEMINNGNEPLAVQLVAGLYDANGNVIDADFAGPPVALEPGQTLPFDFTTFSATNYNQALRGQIASFVVKVDPFWTYPVFGQQVQLKSQNGSAASDNGVITETVDVLNDQSFNVDYAFVLATVTDPSGKVVGYGYTSTDPIAAGASVNVSVTVYVDPALDPASLTVSVIAVAPKP